jgi:uncharacterized protein (DUF58 family)
MTAAVRWRPAPLALSLATASATALAAAVIGRRPELVAFAAPFLGALAGGLRRPRPATQIAVRADRRTERCFEHEPVRIRLTAQVDGAHDDLTLRPILPAGLSLPNLVSRQHIDASGKHGDATRKHAGWGDDWIVRADRWGRFVVPVEVTARAAGGLLVATTSVEVVEVRVYPRPAPQHTTVRVAELTDRIGVHIGRTRGGGVEFAGIRAYTPGDPLSGINWPATARRGRLHVTERLAERASDVVALVDTYLAADVSLDLAVRGAAELAQAALRRGDRAGVLALGSTTRWLGPDIGRRQFYRIVDAVLDAMPTRPATSPAGGRVPRAALPPHACVVAFSPLLDARIGLALQEMRGRGHAIVVVDVLREPPGGTVDRLVERLWRLDRQGMHRDLASLGIPVLPWPEESTLDEALIPLNRRPITVGRPPR